MISEVKLWFRNKDEPEEVDDILLYDGNNDYQDLIYLEAKVDTREMSLSFLGDIFPSVAKLRLNFSIIPSIRDIGCTFSNLKYLSLPQCNIEDLDGISTLSPSLEELYLAFNKISDISVLMNMTSLLVLDLERNLIDNLNQLSYLFLIVKLRELTLSGNPCSKQAVYVEEVKKYLPNLSFLDEKKIREPPKIESIPIKSVEEMLPVHTKRRRRCPTSRNESPTQPKIIPTTPLPADKAPPKTEMRRKRSSKNLPTIPIPPTKVDSEPVITDALKQKIDGYDPVSARADAKFVSANINPKVIVPKVKSKQPGKL